ncbi:glutamate-ammonia-ligase adenylyltransferase [Roseiconus nitratireducens]|uniref:Glutamate-ammonia-ligase adenylyltransferase n=1 Tax=Roseiconus nitratireducens TaxID=2605748 RepID=A0A5M6DGK9_9BACT|nr:glutamate-ammonia-ligase adenylyltransferase [Roseiconus nitratireducens]KAA5545536.1 glutamate-ammonia-ligase adenylyltransferase [Roseiconus nitratireducens]
MQPPSSSSPQTPSADSTTSDNGSFDWIDPQRFDHWPTAENHLRSIWNCGAPADLLAMLRDRLQQHFHDMDDLDSTVANLDRFIAASRSPTSLLALFERDEAALPALLQVFATSQTLANRLIADPESFDLMRASDGQPAERKFLVDELVTELGQLESPSRAALAIRKFVSREVIRIAYGEFVRDLSPDSVGRQLAFVADAVLEAAIQFVTRRLAKQVGIPRRIDDRPVQMTVIGLGHLGGKEMGYGNPLELLFLYDAIEEKNQAHRDFVDQFARDVIQLVGSDDGAALSFAVDTSFRPLGHDVLIGSSDLTAKRLESEGRTWQRVALTKARVVAGSPSLGKQFLSRLQPWIFRRFMSRQDFADIRSLRRKLKRRFESEQTDGDDVSVAPGGRDDIELMIQFLQLLHGGDSKSVRVGSTTEAIDALEREKCLTHQEASVLAKGYGRLCRLQHQLSVMFGRYTSCLPHDDLMRRRLAWQLGVRSPNGVGGDLDRFQSQLRDTFALNRKVLNHLMVDAPQADDADQPEDFAVETELVLDPSPDPELVRQVLSRHSLSDPMRAMDDLTSLATESVRFLSQRRCRHFFASIAPDLLSEIAKTPAPDRTLRTMSEVADSIGGKASLWELLGTNRATMQLMIRLCAATPYLSDILIEMPGMIDELIDSLLMDRLPSAERLDAQSIDLCRRAADIDMVLHGFKNSAHLMIGVRDMLGKEPVEATHRSLSDTAEACVRRVAEYEQERLAVRFGDPVDEHGQPAELVALALGKFGGREPNYHSDLDVVFLYTGDGQTQRRVGGPRKTITNAQFFNQLTAAIVSRINHSSDYGRLYELDGRLRPTGEEGVLAVSLDQFMQRFQRGLAPLWQRLALCKARVITGSRHVRRRANTALVDTLRMSKWHGAMAGEIRDLRMRMQETAGDENLKRGPGGTVDVELIAQMLTLRNIAECPDILASGTIESLGKLADAERLSHEHAAKLINNYRTLRGVEANLRLMNTPARHELPDDEAMMRDLAFLMQEPDPQMIEALVRQARMINRHIFNEIFDSQTSDLPT